MYPQAWINYLIEFHATRDYFECHEILEEHWKEEASKGERQVVWVGLIQVAVGLYHQRRSNYAGAFKMLSSASRILAQETEAVRRLGLDPHSLNQLLQERLMEVERETPYHSLLLPIMDPELLDQCKARAIEEGLTWGQASSMDEALIHRHTLRDRSEVIEERLKQLQERNKK